MLRVGHAAVGVVFVDHVLVRQLQVQVVPSIVFSRKN